MSLADAALLDCQETVWPALMPKLYCALAAAEKNKRKRRNKKDWVFIKFNFVAGQDGAALEKGWVGLLAKIG